MDGEIREIPDAGPSETERRVLEDGGSEDGEIREILDAGHSEGFGGWRLRGRTVRHGDTRCRYSISETERRSLEDGESIVDTGFPETERGGGGLGCSENTCEESVRT